MQAILRLDKGKDIETEKEKEKEKEKKIVKGQFGRFNNLIFISLVGLFNWFAFILYYVWSSTCMLIEHESQLHDCTMHENKKLTLNFTDINDLNV